MCVLILNALRTIGSTVPLYVSLATRPLGDPRAVERAIRRPKPRFIGNCIVKVGRRAWGAGAAGRSLSQRAADIKK